MTLAQDWPLNMARALALIREREGIGRIRGLSCLWVSDCVSVLRTFTVLSHGAGSTYRSLGVMIMMFVSQDGNHTDGPE